MCNDCSHYVDFDLAKKIISHSGLKDDSPGAGDAVKKKAVDDLVSKMADFAGLTESQVRYTTDPGKRSTLLKKKSLYKATKNINSVVVFTVPVSDLLLLP